MKAAEVDTFKRSSDFIEKPCFVYILNAIHILRDTITEFSHSDFYMLTKSPHHPHTPAFAALIRGLLFTTLMLATIAQIDVSETLVMHISREVSLFTLVVILNRLTTNGKRKHQNGCRHLK